MSWLGVVVELCELGVVGERGAPEARGEEITRELVGRFLHRRARWVADCLMCHEIIVEHHLHPRCVTTLEGLQTGEYTVQEVLLALREGLGPDLLSGEYSSGDDCSSVEELSEDDQDAGSEGHGGRASSPIVVE